MNIVFLGPAFPPEMHDFTRGLAEAGARVFGVGDGPLHPKVAPYLSAYLQVPSLTRSSDVHQRVLQWVQGHSIDDVVANWEPTMLTAALLRQSLGIGGMRVDEVQGFRDKPLMRDRVAAAGVRIPKTLRATSIHQVLEASAEIGFPVVVKPVDGAGSADTFVVEDLKELKAVLPKLLHVDEVSVEEFIRGQEFTYETICINGKPVFEGMSRYEPNTLIARQNEWISPIIHSLRNLNLPHLRQARLMGQKALKALGMGTGFTHMEWFLTDKGEVIFGEIACRSPGANMVDLMNYAGDIDLYAAWGQAVVHGGMHPLNPKERSAAIIFKRATGSGRIRRITGLGTFIHKFRPHIARVDLLPIGAPRRNWQQTFLSDGNIVVRHPDPEITLAMAREAATKIQLYAAR